MRNLVFISLLFLLYSCASTKTPPKSISFDFYLRDWDAYEGLVKPSAYHLIFPEDPGNDTIYRSHQSFNIYESEIPDHYFDLPQFVLSAWLSVWNSRLYNSLYIEKPKTPFDDKSYYRSFRRYPPPAKSEDRKEKLELVMQYKDNFDGVDYFFSRNIFHNFKGEKVPACFCLQQENEKWFINDNPPERIQVFMEVFCRMKADVARVFINSTESSYPGFELKQPLPPSGSDYLDNEIMEIFIATHTHTLFNDEKFYELMQQWEKEGKKGLLNYFLEF